MLVAALAGACEEMLFRGLMQTWLATLVSPYVAIVVVAALFGLAHAISPSYVAFAFLLGLVLGYLYYWTGSPPAAMLAHGVYDLIGLLVGVRLFAVR